jgi:hypothetical protein
MMTLLLRFLKSCYSRTRISRSTHHPYDYKFSEVPIEKELIFHEHKMRHPRLLLRCSLQLAESVFCPMTFVLDTCAPKVYLSANAKSILAEYNLHVTDTELGVEYVKLLGGKYRTEDTPEGHAPANIIGLKTLCRWGLTLYDEPSFGCTLKKDFAYLEA